MSALQSVHERRRYMFGFDPEFLAKHDEPVLDPELPIVDPHHHLWDHAIALSVRRVSCGHRLGPQRSRVGLRSVRRDVPRRRRSGFRSRWRNGVRQRSRGDERERRLRSGAGLRGDRRLRRPASSASAWTRFSKRICARPVGGFAAFAAARSGTPTLDQGIVPGLSARTCCSTQIPRGRTAGSRNTA